MAWLEPLILVIFSYGIHQFVTGHVDHMLSCNRDVGVLVLVQINDGPGISRGDYSGQDLVPASSCWTWSRSGSCLWVPAEGLVLWVFPPLAITQSMIYSPQTDCAKSKCRKIDLWLLSNKNNGCMLKIQNETTIAKQNAKAINLTNNQAQRLKIKAFTNTKNKFGLIRSRT